MNISISYLRNVVTTFRQHFTLIKASFLKEVGCVFPKVGSENCLFKKSIVELWLAILGFTKPAPCLKNITTGKKWSKMWTTLLRGVLPVIWLRVMSCPKVFTLLLVLQAQGKISAWISSLAYLGPREAKI